MDIMRLLRKLKSESLEDAGSRWRRRTFPQRNDDAMQNAEFDSGTASDEDVTEFEEEPCLDGVEVMQTSQMHMDRTTGCFSNQPNTTSYNTSALSPHFVSSAVPVSKDLGVSTAGQALTLSGRLSAVSSDFERCSLDFEPPSEVDHHSSEEELASIYRHEQKRKRSQVSPDNQRTSSGDEDLDAECFPRDCDRYRPLPTSGHRCLRDNDGIPISAGHTATSGFTSPRKRHRQASINSTAIQRPSLDLYKMQKTSITRKYGCCSNATTSSSSNCRPRIVKIRTINGSGRPAKSAYNPSVFCFRSISWASSRLKQEPSLSF